MFFLDSGLVSRKLSSLIDAIKIHSFTIDNAIQIGLICYLSVSVFRNQCFLAMHKHDLAFQCWIGDCMVNSCTL